MESVQLGGGEQALDGCGAAAGPLRTGEQPVLLADRNGTDGVLDRIVVDWQTARFGIADKRRDAFLCPHAHIKTMRYLYKMRAVVLPGCRCIWLLLSSAVSVARIRSNLSIPRIRL